VNVECQSLAEADEAITAGANIVMLDNIVGEELHSAAKELKEKWKGKREFLIETSGGIVEGGLVERLGPDIDILSTSAVHQVSSLVLFLERSELMSRAVNMLISRSRSNQGRKLEMVYQCPRLHHMHLAYNFVRIPVQLILHQWSSQPHFCKSLKDWLEVEW